MREFDTDQLFLSHPLAMRDRGDMQTAAPGGGAAAMGQALETGCYYWAEKVAR